MDNRVVITGMGIVSAIGFDVAQNLNNLRNDISGIARAQFLNTQNEDFLFGEVKCSNSQLAKMLEIPFNNYLSRTHLLAVHALKEALTSASVTEATDLALISGTTVGGMDITEMHYPENFPSNLPPVHDCGSNTNSIADYFNCFDYTSTLSTACSSALNSLIFGKLLIESGEKDIVVAGGTEALSLFHVNGFKSLMILDKERCKPFDKERAGLNLGEGAAYLVLESESHAKARGANILAVLSGTGNACDAYHQTATSDNGEGPYLAMQQALKNASLRPEQIDYINAHGTGTQNNDATESFAISRLFGNEKPPVSSTKSFTGHTTSASGSIEAVFSVLALQNNFIPHNLGFSTPDENCIVPYMDNHSNDLILNHIMCNSFGFGGNDSSIIISRYE